MKKSSENFWRASGAQKKGFPNFSPAAAFFSSWRHWKPLKLLKTAKLKKIHSKNLPILEKGAQKNFKCSVDFSKLLGQSGWIKFTSPPPRKGMIDILLSIWYLLKHLLNSLNICMIKVREERICFVPFLCHLFNIPFWHKKLILHRGVDPLKFQINTYGTNLCKTSKNTLLEPLQFYN